MNFNRIQTGRMPWVSMILGLLFLSWVMAVELPLASDAAPPRKSRLSQLIKNKSSLYLPTRLLIGADNKFVVRVPAGNTVVLYLSPLPAGMSTPNGLPLRVGKEHQVLEAIASEKGVATLTVPIPDEVSLVGQPVYVEAYTYGASDYSDLEVLELLGAAGHRVKENRLAIQEPSDGRGAMVLPGLPGVGSDMLRRLSTMGDIYNSDDKERMEQLKDDGNLDRETLRDQNIFIPRSDGAGGL